MPEWYVLNWAAVSIAAFVGVAVIGTMFMASFILAPRRPSEAKATVYESGIPPQPYSWSQLHIRYYIFAILFLIFDVEAVFLFPWILVFLKPETIPAVFYEMLIFIGILFFGVVYGWRKGALQWR